MIKKLDKFIILKFYKYFVSIFFITYFIVLLSLLYDKLPVILSKNLGVKIYLEIIFYLIIFLTPYISVFSSILGSLLFITRLDDNLQLTALKSLGIGIKRVIMSLLMAYVLIGAAIFSFTNFLSPYFKNKCYNLFSRMENLDPTLNLKCGTFINDIPKLGIYIGSKSGNKLNDIVVYIHDNDKLESLFTAKKGEIFSDKKERLITVDLLNGYNYCEGEMFNSILKNSDNKIDIRNIFEKQTVYVDMKEIFKNNNFYYDSISNFNSYILLKKMENEKSKIVTLINDVMNVIDKDYRSTFDAISEKNESIIKDKIYQSLKYGSFDSNVFENAGDVIKNNRRLFNELNSCRREIRGYYIEIFERNVHIIGCFLLIIIGTYIGFLLKRGVLISSLLIGTVFAALYFFGESVFIRFIDIDGNLFILRKSGGPVMILLVIVMYYLCSRTMTFFVDFKKRLHWKKFGREK